MLFSLNCERNSWTRNVFAWLTAVQSRLLPCSRTTATTTRRTRLAWSVKLALFSSSSEEELISASIHVALSRGRETSHEPSVRHRFFSFFQTWPAWTLSAQLSGQSGATQTVSISPPVNFFFFFILERIWSCSFHWSVIVTRLPYQAGSPYHGRLGKLCAA